jgi:tRNA (guanine10-N2)-dimethyltransferase
VFDLFFFLSGENPSLPFSEVISVLEAEELSFFNVKVLPQILLLKGDLKCLDAASRRCGFLKSDGIRILTCEARKDEIIKLAKDAPFEKFVSKNESFSARIHGIHESKLDIDSKMLEGDLGEIILKRVEGARVDLSNPSKVFTGFLAEKTFVFGLRTFETQHKFEDRKPGKRPFSHPAAFPPKLARCMVNLTKPKADEIVFDPFCGAGSMLIEAGLIGCQVVGIDIDPKMVKGSSVNLRHFGVAPLGLIVGDACSLGLREVAHIVTDPPYGRSSSTHGFKPKKLIENFLRFSLENMGKGGFLCIASPKNVTADLVGSDLGFIVTERHFAYVNKDLTRQIVVFRKL